VKWDVFFGRKKEARDRERDEIRGLVQQIERTAPRFYSKDRAARYYHYEQVRAYVRPLRLLLEAVADRKALREDEGEAVRTLFLRLRAFYDVRDRLSLEEAVRDVRLRRKLVHLLLIFYGRKDVDTERLSGMLEPLLAARGEGQ
jgi:hypothetical protein